MAELATIIAGRAGSKGALLPILHDVQAAFGHVSNDAIVAIAAALNLTRAEVHGVVSFYHDFRASAPALPVIKICRAEACQARGVEALIAEAQALAKNQMLVEPVYCLGLCAVGPAAMIGDQQYARLDTEKLGALIKANA